jgi:endonuclease/exonuclease/phosphatase family metal-dependent hydrolase
VLETIATIVANIEPDIFAYAEVGLGAPRTAYVNQHDVLMRLLQAPHGYALPKYRSQLLARAPFHVGNGNGVSVFVPHATLSSFHLRTGGKTLVLEVVLPDTRIYVVHLALTHRQREAQLRELAERVNVDTTRRVLVVGDFNVFEGIEQYDHVLQPHGILPELPVEPTFPVYQPTYVLDGCLWRRVDGSKPRVSVVPHAVSDHAPILIEC